MIEGSAADAFAYSLSNFAEILFPCIEAVDPSSVLEIGAFKGTTTRDLLEWAQERESDTEIIAMEPSPRDDFLELVAERPELKVVEELSLEALLQLPIPDVILLDGDHNYYTLSRELALIWDRSPAERLPLLVMHDVGWPLARRDQYAAPDRIPEEHRHPYAHAVGLAPGEPGTVHGGLRFQWVAEREGGPRNGVLTAIEDFVGEHEGLQLATVPAFFGMGVVWHRDASWADQVASIVAPYDRNPLLARLEQNRIAHLIARLDVDLELDEERELSRKQGLLLETISNSPAFAVAERLSSLRRRGQPAFSRVEIENLLEQNGAS